MTHNHRQHGVTIGGKRYTVDEHGKFLPINPETRPTGDQDGQNGNNTPTEWLDDPPLVERPGQEGA